MTSVTESVMMCGWRDIMNKAITDHNIGNRDNVIQLSYIGLIIIMLTATLFVPLPGMLQYETIMWDVL